MSNNVFEQAQKTRTGQSVLERFSRSVGFCPLILYLGGNYWTDHPGHPTHTPMTYFASCSPLIAMEFTECRMHQIQSLEVHRCKSLLVASHMRYKPFGCAHFCDQMPLCDGCQRQVRDLRAVGDRKQLND